MVVYNPGDGTVRLGASKYGDPFRGHEHSIWPVDIVGDRPLSLFGSAD